MCAALARAHDLGVIHRDLKSDNILLTERGGRKDFVKILDFGLAALKRDARLAPKGAVFGTPEYMSPEQARGEDAQSSSDLYAVGVLLYEMLTGQLPFRATDREALLEMQQHQKPAAPKTLNPDVNPHAEKIAMRLLEKSSSQRYHDAHHLKEELKKLQRSLPSSQAWELAGNVRPASPPSPPPPQSPAVTEWATRAAVFTRMASRAFSGHDTPQDLTAALAQTWDLAARASRLEGEVASLTRKIDSLERRGRALRAEIGRKVEDLAAEESRTLRQAKAHAKDASRAKKDFEALQRHSAETRRQADAAAAKKEFNPGVYERAGAALAAMTAKAEELGRYEQRQLTCTEQARGLRRQIDQLRSQLDRYFEALEADLSRGREQIVARTRDGLKLEAAFGETSKKLLEALKDKPECRDLVLEITQADQPPAETQG
jgi:serine/threonine-protein kinase